MFVFLKEFINFMLYIYIYNYLLSFLESTQGYNNGEPGENQMRDAKINSLTVAL